MVNSRTNNATKRLAIGTVIYMIGNLTSKILQMLILPILTATLSTSEYGYYDLVITTISLVTPLITLQIIEGMFRFMFNASEDEKKNIISTVTVFLFESIILLAIFVLVANVCIPSIKYPFLIFLNYVSFVAFTYYQKLARCQNKNKIFSISGVVNTITMLLLQAIFLLFLKMSVDGMLIANAASYFLSALYISRKIPIKRYLSLNSVNMKSLKKMLVYSAPLVPNSVGWWIVASSDRFLITYFLSTSANGIFSIAGKFSQLLTLMTTVFQLAWQESAILEENSKHRDLFYSNTFNTYMLLLLGAYLVFLPFIRLIFPFLIDSSYQFGYLYSPILLIGSIFSAFSQFYGSSYLVFKKTKGAFTTTIVAAIINIMINFSLINQIGLFAPAIGTALSFFVQWILRAYQMREEFRIQINYKQFFTLIFFIVISTIAYYSNYIINITSLFIGSFLFILMNRKIIISILKKIKCKFLNSK